MNEVISKNNEDLVSYNTVKDKLDKASELIDDIVLKKYLNNLSQYDVIPLPDELKDISDIRLFKITEMVYQKNEYSTYKFATVFNSLQSLNCGIFILMDSDGNKTEFYMGVRSLDNKRTTKSLKNTLENALIGQFPGVKTKDFMDEDALEILSNIPSSNIASVSCISNNKNINYNDNEKFIQGLEKLVTAMQGRKYSAVILAKSITTDELQNIRNAYEKIYTDLSPFETMQLSYGTNTAINISKSLSNSFTKGTSHTEGVSYSVGKSEQKTITTSTNRSVSSQDKPTMLLKSLASAALSGIAIATAPLTGWASYAVALGTEGGRLALSSISPKTITESEGKSESNSTSISKNYGTNSSDTLTESETATNTDTEGHTQGSSSTMQLTMKNKVLIDILQKIDLQLKRIDECESVGMWESAAYFLSDTSETAEMLAGTYKALIKGENSGLEVSAINCWNRKKKNDKKDKNQLLYDYITNFIHPVFQYSDGINVTATSLSSSNELGIQMGLPRKSVCGFPVVHHAEFGKEVVSYNQKENNRKLKLGNIFSMGSETKTEVNLDTDSLTMHTFVTGSTGSGKSNTIYTILNSLKKKDNIPFLIIEPAKGEYKNIFGNFEDVSVYGTNPKKTKILKINPFSFPDDIHVLEHLDRLIDIFNVCWPMYAAMPAILKQAMERAYISVGWDLIKSENTDGKKFPNFKDLLDEIENVIEESKYSADNKGDYSGALITRINSLTTGLNSMIFTSDEISNEDLFDKNVIIDLSRVGSSETKSLLMGLIVMKLNEYRMSVGNTNSPLKHITVLEEAHNLLKRNQIETGESNLQGKSVELLANSIAEMRTYGEGFIIADQSPGLLDMSVIRNTNTKIILRLPEKSDRELIGLSANLKEEQLEELSKLRKGVAAVYQNDWIDPVLVKVDKCELDEVKYEYIGEINSANYNYEELINFLLQGRIVQKLKFNIENIEKNLNHIKLTNNNIKYIRELIEEYRKKGTTKQYSSADYKQLSKIITDILDFRHIVEHKVVKSNNYKELNLELGELIKQKLPNIAPLCKHEIIKSLLRDMTLQNSEKEMREKIYKGWCEMFEGDRIYEK